MIQRPAQDEILVGVPSAGTLLDHHRKLQLFFDRMLLAGHEERIDGQTVIVWHVEGKEPLAARDPLHAATVARLSQRVELVSRAAHELHAILAANPRSAQVEVGPLVCDLLQRRSDDHRSPKLLRAEAEVLAHVLDRGAKAVRHALAQPSLFADERGASLAAWAYLPPKAILSEPFVPAPAPAPVPAPAPIAVDPPPPIAPGEPDAPAPPEAPWPPLVGAPPVDPDPPQTVPEAPEGQREGRWWPWIALALAFLLLAGFLAWLLFPGEAHLSRLDAALVSPSASAAPMPRSEADRRLGTLDVELPPPPVRRVLQFLKPEGPRDP